MSAARLAALLGATLLALAARGAPFAQPFELSRQFPPGTTFMGVRPLGALLLDPVRVAGLPLVELSDLAWDADEGLLYAVSDQGSLFHLRPVLRDGRLVGARVLAAYPLRDRHGVALAGAAADAEGMDVRGARNARHGDAVLVISFERRHRIAEYRPDGRLIRTLPLPAPLAGANRFASPNQGLEALTLDPALGVLVAPERPLAHTRPGHVPIVAAGGRRWDYPLRAEPNPALVALQALGEATLLVLERAHGPMFLPVVISLRVVSLAATGGRALAPRTVAVLDSSRGWAVDNFEGLALHEGRRFFLVSDDNDRPLQRTLLAYLELVTPVRDLEGAIPEFEPRQERSR